MTTEDAHLIVDVESPITASELEHLTERVHTLDGTLEVTSLDPAEHASQR